MEDFGNCKGPLTSPSQTGPSTSLSSSAFSIHKHIHKLDETVVNKIAAGEVIVRPANALKELIENSLDAGATLITVTIKNGGLDYVQIHDNGHGIYKQDLPMACERFATSKISHFDDLSNLDSFGFRGEALASISYVAKIRILSRTVDSQCGYQMDYSNGKPMLDQAKPCAATVGTIITVEDLFYNNPNRRLTLSSPADEAMRIMDVIMKYAVQNPKVGFTLKKYGQHVVELRTPPNSSTLENIKIIFGNSVAKELIPIDGQLDKINLSFSGFVSHANYPGKKYNCLMFINGRAVSVPKLKKCIEALYDTLLPKHTFPFVYISIVLPPSLIDVNVHPTKAEVYFRFDEEIIKFIFDHLKNCLMQHNQSRVFPSQISSPAHLPSSRARNIIPVASNPEDSFLSQASTIVPQSRQAPQSSVRTDSRAQTLDGFLGPSYKEGNPEEDCSASLVSVLTTKKMARPFNLSSLLQLRACIEENMDDGLRKILAEHKFVGVASENMALIQHDVDLYAVNLTQLSEELFYQLMIYDFGNFGVITLSDPLSVAVLMDFALESDTTSPIDNLDERRQIAQRAANCLLEKGEMLADYFSLQFSQDGDLVNLPLLLSDYIPPLCELPFYLARLSGEVDWKHEKECFEQFARITSQFYSFKRDYYAEQEKGGDVKWKWSVEHVLFPALKTMLLPPKSMRSDKTFNHLSSLPDLYKVFERC